MLIKLKQTGNLAGSELLDRVFEVSADQGIFEVISVYEEKDLDGKSDYMVDISTNHITDIELRDFLDFMESRV